MFFPDEMIQTKKRGLGGRYTPSISGVDTSNLNDLFTDKSFDQVSPHSILRNLITNVEKCVKNSFHKTDEYMIRCAVKTEYDMVMTNEKKIQRLNSGRSCQGTIRDAAYMTKLRTCYTGRKNYKSAKQFKKTLKGVIKQPGKTDLDNLLRGMKLMEKNQMISKQYYLLMSSTNSKAKRPRIRRLDFTKMIR